MLDCVFCLGCIVLHGGILEEGFRQDGQEGLVVEKIVEGTRAWTRREGEIWRNMEVATPMVFRKHDSTRILEIFLEHGHAATSPVGFILVPLHQVG